MDLRLLTRVEHVKRDERAGRRESVLPPPQSFAQGTPTVRAVVGSVPGDVAVVGWNDPDDLPARLTPTLTSVRRAPALLARPVVRESSR